MSVIIAYIDISNDNCNEVLEKKYSSISEAFIPAINSDINVYSNIEHEVVQFKVMEISIMVERDHDKFNVLLERKE